MIKNYQTRPRKVRAVLWDGANLEEINTLLDGSNGEVTRGDAGYLILRTPGREMRVVEPGMWVSVGDAITITHSAQAFSLIFEEDNSE